MTTNIVIYPHNTFSMYDGGLVAFYTLAKLLNEAGINAFIDSNCGTTQNEICNKFYDKDKTPLDDFIAIYCEATAGNPLNARRSIRWLLSKLGRNVPSVQHTWEPDDLVYFYNSELHFPLNASVHKLLTVMHIPDIYVDLKQPRYGTCYVTRKMKFPTYREDYPKSKTEHIKLKRSWINIDNALEERTARGDRYVSIFNKYENFVSYDPMTFTNVIAALCGCVSIVNPSLYMDKQKWFNQTCFGPYMKAKGLKDLHGITYGMADIARAKETIEHSREQITDMAAYYNKQMIDSFIDDITTDKKHKNTVKHNFR